MPPFYVSALQGDELTEEPPEALPALVRPPCPRLWQIRLGLGPNAAPKARGDAALFHLDKIMPQRFPLVIGQPHVSEQHQRPWVHHA